MAKTIGDNTYHVSDEEDESDRKNNSNKNLENYPPG